MKNMTDHETKYNTLKVLSHTQNEQVSAIN